MCLISMEEKQLWNLKTTVLRFRFKEVEEPWLWAKLLKRSTFCIFYK